MNKILFASVFMLITTWQANAGLIFHFQDDVGGVSMTSSGSIDVSGLFLTAGINGWGGIGIEENSNHDIIGNTTGGGINLTYAFNEGTDFSAWASANGPWASDNFNWLSAGDNFSFATYFFSQNFEQMPGLGIRREDLIGDIWSTNQTWFNAGQTLASLQMFVGEYTVTDAVSGESITFLIGNPVSVPEPASLAILGLGLAGLAMKRRRKIK